MRKKLVIVYSLCWTVALSSSKWLKKKHNITTVFKIKIKIPFAVLNVDLVSFCCLLVAAVLFYMQLVFGSQLKTQYESQNWQVVNLVAAWRASSTNMAGHLFKLSVCVSLCVLDKDMLFMTRRSSG